MTEREKSYLREHFTDEESYKAAALRVEEGEPLAYVIGEWYFWRQTYRVSPQVLIPRADTEHLVEQLIKLLPEGGKFLDICTGSGCIAISALCDRPDATADAVEISAGAVEIAEYNAEKYGISNRCRIFCSDATTEACLERLCRENGADAEIYDIIVSNPPYIQSDIIDTLSVQVKAEPHGALDGGADGMDFYRAFLSLYPPLLKKSGVILFEIGYDQAELIKEAAISAGASECTILRDFGGNDRVAVIRF